MNLGTPGVEGPSMDRLPAMSSSTLGPELAQADLPGMPDSATLRKELAQLRQEMHDLSLTPITDEESSRVMEKKMAETRARLRQLLLKLGAQAKSARTVPEKPVSRSAPPLMPHAVEHAAPPTLLPNLSSTGAATSGHSGAMSPHTEKMLELPSKPVDPLALAQSLFQTGDYANALPAYQAVDSGSAAARDRVAQQYMVATCLRHLGRFDEAAAIYREVAGMREGEVFAECAQWQLNSIRWRRDILTQVDQLKQRRQEVEVKP